MVLADSPTDEATDGALRRAVAVGGAGWRARVLATVPANLKSPRWLADQAVALADEAGLKVTVWDEAKLEKDGFGGIVGVGRGSANPSCLIRLDYTPSTSSAEPVPGPRAWCSSARASPSTPVACRSSPPSR